MQSESPVEDDQEIFGSEFCAGYTDILGKWNSGFYCPNGESSEALFCCGTGTYKYCCVRRELIPSRDYLASLPLLLGVVFVVIAVLGLVTLLILGCCCFCSCCSYYKKRQPRIDAGPLYRLQCSSTASGVANMYSFSTQNSIATTPIDNQISHSHLLVDLEAANGEMSPRNNGMTTMTRGHTFSSDAIPIPAAKSKSVGFTLDNEGDERGGSNPHETRPGPFIIHSDRPRGLDASTPGNGGISRPTSLLTLCSPVPAVVGPNVGPLVGPTTIGFDIIPKTDQSTPDISSVAIRIPTDDSLYHSTKF